MCGVLRTRWGRPPYAGPVPRPAKWLKRAVGPGAEPPRLDAAGVVQVKVGLLGVSPTLWRQRADQQACALVVAHLSLGQQQDHGPGVSVADDVQLGVQPTLGAPDPPRPLFFAADLLPCGGP